MAEQHREVAHQAVASSLAPDRIHIWQFGLDARPDVQLLDVTERARAARFRFERDRVRFVVAHSVLRKLLSSYMCDTAAAEVEFAEACNGKPMLAPSMKTNLSFNLSHSDRFGILAVGLGLDIGVDIELLRAPRDLKALAGSVMTEVERADFAELPESQLIHRFFTAWTRKEACIKATGDGLRVSPRTLNVGLTPDSRELNIGANVRGQVQTIIDDGKCLASIATVGKLPRLHFFKISDN